ncbi:MAG: preprotein translocase subunit YajC [Gammaproteobacteria bacterium]|nr:preprotein translocase subunit YajC [Gammaproteobacteria bacterium]MYC26046.1 preprotein translocase subunit YajC [Gammaproteobacteria bacterium]
MNWIETVVYAGAQGGEKASPLPMLLVIAGMIVLFYFFLIRPQQKQRKRHQELVSALQRGDEVIMASGMMGIISKVEEDNVTVRVAKNTELRFQKQAVSATLPKGSITNLDG